MGDVMPFRRPPDALQDATALFLRTGDPIALAATVAAWRARYQQQPVSEPYRFAETVPMPRSAWDELPSDCNLKETDHDC